MAAWLTVAGVEMPCPVSLSIGNEIIWSANTGRTASGKMVGDVITTKENLSIEWGILTKAEYNKIKNNIKAGFFVVSIPELNISINAYRGTLTGVLLGTLGNTTYYKSANCSIIQQ